MVGVERFEYTIEEKHKGRRQMPAKRRSHVVRQSVIAAYLLLARMALSLQT